MSPEAFIEKIEAGFPLLRPKTVRFPSEAFMIDVVIEGVIYVIEYLPSIGIGLSRQDTAVFGWEGFEKTFEDFQDAFDYLSTLTGRPLA